jgi:hypothetical protein
VYFSITATPVTGGSRAIFGGEYGAGYDQYNRWLRTLPKLGNAQTAALGGAYGAGDAVEKYGGWVLIGSVVLIVLIVVIINN